MNKQTVFVLSYTSEHYDNEEQYQGSENILLGLFSTRDKAERYRETAECCPFDADIEEVELDALCKGELK